MEFQAPPAAIYDDKLTTVRIDAQWERVDTRFRGMNHFALSYTHGFKDLLDSLDDYDSAAVGGASRFQPASTSSTHSVSSRIVTHGT